MNVREEIKQLREFNQRRPFDSGLRGVGAEIGVCKGFHARAMLKRNPWIQRLYLVDPYKPRWFSNPGYARDYAHRLNGLLARLLLTRYRKKCRFVYHTSDCLDCIEPLNFCYIDAAHDYESVSRDIRNAWPCIVPGGILGGHDYDLPGVKKAVDEFTMLPPHNRFNDWWIIKP